MKWVFALLLVTIAPLSWAQDKPPEDDPRDAELRMLKATVKHQAEANEPLRAKIQEQVKVIAEEKKKEAEQEKRIAELQKQIASLTAELDKLKGLVNPSNSLAQPDGSVVVTATQIETLGEKFEGKKVKMLLCSFRGASTTHVDEMPGVTLADNGLISRVDTNEMKKWIGFSVSDGNGNLFTKCFAVKDDLGEYLASMKEGTRVNISGFVVKLRYAGNYGIVCNKVEKLPDDQQKRR